MTTCSLTAQSYDNTEQGGTYGPIIRIPLSQHPCLHTCDPGT